ncbi:MAG: peptide chain release factor 1 [Oscillospiraceae bacterium]|jgi:peptide chain release factor 1|nr:peptide chain release factor 1 [Oscillospiraceae bacterium]
MLDKLKLAERRYAELETLLAAAGTAGDRKLYRDRMREYKSLTPLIGKYREYKKAERNFTEAKELLSEGGLDADFREMAQAQSDENRELMERYGEELKILLLPRDPDDDRNVIIEIRGGAGGEESALFVNSLFRMYSMYAALKNWKIEVVNSNPTELGGYKEISFSVAGDGAYAKMKYESGVHRVQRVPETEAQGRIHTSTVTVAVLPEVEEVDVEINPADLETQTFRASGAGGQHINKTESAIRVIHRPSGVVVECQEERSQHKNKDKAMKMLYSKLYEVKMKEQTGKIAEERRIQVGTGDRSERIRTYNYPQGRVTDHRIGLTLYRLEAVLNGDCDEVFDALAVADKAAKLTAGG